ncbi:MAG TPA: tetratricopeptide repeat protein [Caulobacteraceae bacterium]|jgi:tetratricopeptide (TPR) repeat protein
MPERRSLLLIAAFAAACAGCASAGPFGDLRVSGGARDNSPYGLFLAGQAALQGGEADVAAAYFARAQAAAPREGTITERAFTAALLNGDLDRAGKLAREVGSSSPLAEPLSGLAEGVELLAEGRSRQAAARLKAASGSPGIGAAAALVRPWAEAGAGNWEAALTGANSPDRLFNLIASLNQAQLFERAKRYDEAETAFKAAMAQRGAKPLFAATYGAFLERRGRQAEAVALYDELIAAGQADDELRAARARAAGGRAPPPMLTLQQGAAQALLPAAAAMLGDRQLESGTVYLRLALRLDPTREEAALLLGDIKTQQEDVDAARKAYAGIPASSPRYLAAQARLAWSYQEKEPARAVEIARAAAAARPQDDDAQVLLAELLRADKRYAEAAQVMDGVVARTAAAPDWKYHYMRGAVLERAGRWPEAEADLKQALVLKPDQPELLNYLGYAWIERRQRVKEALAMIEKAIAAEPDNGAYIDSLGWAYYQLGDYRTALGHVERAVQLMPGDPEVNDHLGDVYWRVGRRDEARYKWRAVLTLEPPSEIKSRAEAKLASPQGPDAVATAAVTETR